ncbi:MAG: hypothetical protein NC548_65535, partial [Lachnospiraceae bacterium]|nr:hypothetical protein [Lachnospiraceae bacterium]
MILTKQLNIDVSQQAPGIVNLSGGVGSENYDRDKNGNKVDNDPLNNAEQYINKPASSIPTIFARALFFNSALLNINKVKSNKETAYNIVVSQWLDLLELIFRKGGRLKYVKWNVDDQTGKLINNKMGNNKLKKLGEALKAHMEIYLPDTKNITLIFDEEGILMGGTSPYTFVYTAPNYNSGLPVLSLLDREEDFQDFLIRLYLAMRRSGVTRNPETRDQFSGFTAYMENVLRDNEVRRRFPPASYPLDKFSYANFEKSYEKVKGSNGQNVLISALPGLSLYLFMRKEGEFASDFYIKSNVMEFMPAETPLALPLSEQTDDYARYILHDKVNFGQGFDVSQIGGIEYGKARELPDNSGIEHTWLTQIDFLEDKLIQLPYLVDSAKFFGAINMPSTSPDEASVSYLLPIKPVLLRLFTVEKLKELINFELLDKGEYKGMIQITLRIPVMNLDEEDRGYVIYTKLYNPYTSVYATAADGSSKKDAISVGISPFVRFSEPDKGLDDKSDANKGLDAKPAPIADSYNVFLQASNLANNQDIKLGFYKVGKGELTKNEAKYTERFVDVKGSLQHKASFYDVLSPFEGMQICLMENGRQTGGAMLFPIWQKGHASGRRNFTYSIDFGTTNTHLAFISYAMSNGEKSNPATEKS